MKKRFNSPGMTIIEILVSIALISLVVLFLMFLITDVNNDSNLAKIKIDANYGRSAIIKTVQDDFKNNPISEIKKLGSSPGIEISFDTTSTCPPGFKKVASKCTKTLKVFDNRITYGQDGGTKPEEFLIPIEGAKYLKNEVSLCVYSYDSGGITTGKFIKIMIPMDLSATIYQESDLNLNIELTYYSGDATFTVSNPNLITDKVCE